MPVRAIGRTNAGMFASRASAAEVHRTGIGSPAWPCALGARPSPAIIAGERAFAADGRSPRSQLADARAAALRLVGTDPHAE